MLDLHRRPNIHRADDTPGTVEARLLPTTADRPCWITIKQRRVCSLLMNQRSGRNLSDIERVVTRTRAVQIIGKSKRELEKMRAAGHLVGLVLQELRNMVGVGVTTLEIDRAAEKMITDAGALPTFKGYHGFPYSICASVNEQVVHGFPSDYELKDGDIFSIDCGATLAGFVGDTATTVPVGKVGEETLQLVRITEEALSWYPAVPSGRHLVESGQRSNACEDTLCFVRIILAMDAVAA